MRIVAWILAGVAVLATGAAGAQVLVDPTRPPASQAGAEGDAGVGSGAPILQSVMISTAVKAAIINGEVVRLGEKFGSAQLVKVSENEVVLRYGNDEQVLKLYPGVEKTRAAPAGESAAKGPTAGAGKR